MKKTLMVGAVAFATVAVPVVGLTNYDVKAATTHTLNLTVTEVCSFTRSVGEATKSVSMAMNALNTDATNTFKVICNNAAGYSVAAVFTKITGVGDDIAYSATTPTAGSGTWTATKDGTSPANIAGTWQSGSSTYTGGTLMSASGVTSSSGTTQKVIYKIGTSATQAHGSYSGTATYTLTQN